MRVALDAQLTVGTATGIGEYVRGLAPALRDAGVDVVELRAERLDPWRFDRRVLWDQVLLPSRAACSGAKILHCTAGTMPLALPLPTVVTVHDVAWLRVQQHAPWYAQRYLGAFSLACYRKAAAVLTDSAFSRTELLDVHPRLDHERVRAIAPGVAREFSALERRGDGRTILVVGTVEPRKNLAQLVRLLPRLPDARIVSVGPATPYARECLELAARLRVDSRVELRGYVPLAALLELYASAAAAAVPSTYEGFGYAVAQALCAGLPCVASDRASLPEVGGGDARIVALDDDAWIAALGDALAGGLDEHARAARARNVARFSWSAAAAAVASIYERVAG